MQLSNYLFPNWAKIAFLFGPLLFAFFHFDISGYLYIFDISALIYVVFSIFTHKNVLNDDIKLLLFIASIYLVNQIFQDHINHSENINLLKGIAKSILNLCIIFYIYCYANLLHRNKLSLASYYFLPIIISLTLVYFGQPNIHAIDGDWWKFGLALPVTLAGMIVTRKYSISVYGLSLIALGWLNLILGFRSLGVFVLAGGIFSFLLLFGSNRIPRLLMVGFTLIATLFFYQKIIYPTLPNKEVKKIQTQLVKQDSAKKPESEIIPFQLLRSARPEFFSALNHISKDLPGSLFIGIGTWAKQEDGTLFKSHSHIIGDFAYYGIIGLSFWVFVLLLATKYIISILNDQVKDATFSLVIYGLLIWDVFFSPFAGDHRFMTIFYFMYLHAAFNGGKKES